MLGAGGTPTPTTLQVPRLTEGRGSDAGIRGAARGLACLALLVFLLPTSHAAAAEPLVLPGLKAYFKATKTVVVPKPLRLSFIVRSPTGANEDHYPVACFTMQIRTQRESAWAKRARVVFSMEVRRGSEIVQQLQRTLRFQDRYRSVAFVNSCSEPVARHPRWDLEPGDVVGVEARIKGISRLRAGEVLEWSADAEDSNLLPGIHFILYPRRGRPSVAGLALKNVAGTLLITQVSEEQSVIGVLGFQF